MALSPFPTSALEPGGVLPEDSKWIGVDFDATLATYDIWRGDGHCGEPIAPMVNRVKQWLAEGEDVRIFTARVGPGVMNERVARRAITDWCVKHIGRGLPITATKDYGMVELWDDRAREVIPNTGVLAVDAEAASYRCI